MAIIHGALGKWHYSAFRPLLLTPLLKGVVSWDDPTTPDIKAFASRLALSMPYMTSFILNPTATFRQTTIQGVDIGIWETNTGGTLILATNTNYSPVTVRIVDLLPSVRILNLEHILDTGTTVNFNQADISFEAVGSGAFIMKPS